MRHFTSIADVDNLENLLQQAILLKQNPFSFKKLGRNSTLGLIFMNPSLRTRLSTQKAAMNLGMDVMVMNMDKEGWTLELNEGAVMNGHTVEHIKDAAAVMGEYCDIIGIRCFSAFKSREEDYSEYMLQKFIRYSRRPVISLESATRHPLQSFADLLTIRENWHEARKPRVVLSWAPHVKPLPQAVANSFSEWILKSNAELVITYPEGFDLEESFTKGATIMHRQEEALEGADFVYVKNWSSYQDYGKVLQGADHWLLDERKMNLTNKAKLMHCLPVRRNIELPDTLLDSPDSLIYRQASNRLFAAQAVLLDILKSNKTQG